MPPPPGVTCVIQPGGSIRDDEAIAAAADEHGIAMLFTDMRQFPPLMEQIDEKY
ncbi:hypothetical protein [Escherichia coli]|uniref:hypothetical protein n=1 Tax=Escherichia coli TaxID=562 RepID=UPI00388F068A